MFLPYLTYANQGEPGPNEHTPDERPLPSSSLSFPVSSNVPGLINSTTKGPIKKTSSAVQASSGFTSIIETTKIIQSQTLTKILANTSISRGDVLASLSQTTTIILNLSQNTPHVASSKAQSSPQSTLRTIPSQKEDVFSTLQHSFKTTKPLSPSSNPFKPLLSTANSLAHTSIIESSISPSG